MHPQGLGTVLSALSSGKQKSSPPPAIMVVREGEYQIPSVVVVLVQARETQTDTRHIERLVMPSGSSRSERYLDKDPPPIPHKSLGTLYGSAALLI